VKQDVTARKQAEEALRWRTTFFEALMDSSLDGILVVDSSGKKILQNRRMIELWKIPPHIADDPNDDAQVRFVSSRVKSMPGIHQQDRQPLREHRCGQPG
jgi:PAS domain-containing protein